MAKLARSQPHVFLRRRLLGYEYIADVGVFSRFGYNVRIVDPVVWRLASA